MAEKEQHNETVKTDEKNDDIPKPQSATANKKKNGDKPEEENERSIEQIDAELDELRPKPSSPETQRKIEEKQREKDEEEQQKHEKSPMPIEVKDNNEGETTHKDNELIPGQPDPTVTDDMKIPVMNERGDIELKSQQGSVLNKNKNKPPDSNNQPEQNNNSPEQDKNPSENKNQQSEKNKEAEN